LAELPASDLSQIAARAQKKQQAIVDKNLSPDDSTIFPVTPTKIGPTPTGQSNGVEGITNSVSNAAMAGSRQASVGIDPFAPPTSNGDGLEPEPQDTEYGSLSPTQRNAALRRTGMEVTNHAIDPVTRKARRSASGASVLEFKSPIGGQQVYLAEDAAPAHAALMKAVNDSNLRAMPVDGDDDYQVGWRVHPDDRAQFMEMARYLEAGDLSDDGSTLRVRFGESNSLNRSFMRSPFGTKKKAR